MASLVSSESFPVFDTKEQNTIAPRWKKWKRGFDYYIKGKGITEDAQQASWLLHCAGSDVQDIYENLPEPPAVEGESELGKTLRKLDIYFKSFVNVPLERHMFRGLKQEKEESVDQFVGRLLQRAEYCDFTDKDDQVRDQIIQSCTSTTIKRKLLEKGRDLTLTQAQTIARSVEAVDSQMSQMESRDTRAESVSKICSKPNKQSHRNKSSNPRQQNSNAGRNYGTGPRCYRCGRLGHKASDPNCTARGKICEKCGLKDHFSRCCKTRDSRKNSSSETKKVNCTEEKYENSDDSSYTFAVNTEQADKITLSLGGIPVKMMVDSGASCNIIDKQMWENLKEQHIKCETSKCSKKLFAYGSIIPLPVIGVFKAELRVSNVKTLAEIVVVDTKGEPLLGRKTAKALGVLSIGLPNKSVNSVSDSYSDVFQGIGKLKGRQIDIHVNPDIKPVVQQYRRPPFSMRKKIEARLDEYMKLDIIEPVSGPTKWASPIVVVPKSDGDVRICVDMRRPNQAIIRERFPIPTVDEVLSDLNESTVFSKLDLRSGYHQLELSEAARDITTFTTHKGNFRYKRLMFGISSAPEIYQKTLQEVFQDCEGAKNISDDIIVHAKNEKEHDERLEKVMNTIRENGLTLNKEKCVFKMTKLVFMGHVLSEKGLGPTESKVKAVKEAREPKNVQEVRSFLGLIGFLSRYIPDLATIAEPLWKLTRKGESFEFGQEQQKAFSEIKARVCTAETLAYFKLGCKTTVIADASPVGLGGILIQEQDGQQRVVCYASYSVSDIERRYSQTEKEALGLVWACERFHMYLLGTEFDLLTDHKPLEMIFSPSSKPSARIERWLLRMLPYKFNVRYIKGKDNIADPLSRLLNSEPASKPISTSLRAEEYVKFIAESSVPRAVTVKEVKEASAEDSELCELSMCIRSGNFDRVPDKRYLLVKDELTMIGEHVILRGTRLVIPQSLRNRVLEIAHEGHQRIVKTKQRLRTKVWWPGIDQEAERLCKACHGCQLTEKVSIPEPMVRTELPPGKWQDVCVDFLGPLPSGHNLFVVVDYYSRFYEVKVMKTITAEKTIKALDDIFATHGLPVTLSSDNGPQLASKEMSDYLENLGIDHRRVTPYWAQANGEVEIQNKSLVNFLKICQAEKKDFRKELNTFLTAYRTTPHSTTGIPPAELLFGRKIRTKLPELRHTEFDTIIRDKDSEMKMRGKLYADSKRKAVERDIQVGDKVLVEQRKEGKLSTHYATDPYEVMRKQGNSVVIKSSENVLYKRNVAHMKKFVEQGEQTVERQTSQAAETINLPVGTPVKVPSPAITPKQTPAREMSARSRRLPAKYKDFEMI